MRRKAWAMMMFIGSGRQRNSRRKSYGVCDNDFCIHGNSWSNCIGDCRDNQHDRSYCLDYIVDSTAQGYSPGRKAQKIWFDYRVDFVFAANICSYWFYSLLVCLNIELVEMEIMLDQIIKNCLDQMQEFVNGVIFLISFLALRRRTGGFHMKTFKACYVATIGTFIGVLLVKNIMYTK